MWHLLPKNLYKNNFKAHLFFPQLILLSLLLHLLVLLLCFLSKQQSLNLHIKINKNQIYSNNIVVLPFEKNVPGALEKLKKNVNKKVTNSSSKLKPESKIGAYAPKIKTTNSKAPKIFIDKKANKAASKIQSKKSLKQSKLEKSIQAKEVQKMEMAEEPVLAQDQILPEQKIDKKEEKLIENKVENINDKNSDDVVYIGRQDLQMIEIYQNVQQEVSLHWFPPVGLSKDLKCTASFSIDQHGKISDIKIEKSSKALAYDMSVRNAIPKINLPKQVWGKKVSLEFTQG